VQSSEARQHQRVDHAPTLRLTCAVGERYFRAVLRNWTAYSLTPSKKNSYKKNTNAPPHPPPSFDGSSACFVLSAAWEVAAVGVAVVPSVSLFTDGDSTGGVLAASDGDGIGGACAGVSIGAAGVEQHSLCLCVRSRTSISRSWRMSSSSVASSSLVLALAGAAAARGEAHLRRAALARWKREAEDFGVVGVVGGRSGECTGRDGDSGAVGGDGSHDCDAIDVEADGSEVELAACEVNDDAVAAAGMRRCF